MLKEFKDFIMRGNVLDLAVAVIIGGAFGKIISSLVTDILMPPLGLVLGNVDFSNLYINLSGTPFGSLAEAQAAGAPTLNYGLFLNNIINFVIVAAAIFADHQAGQPPAAAEARGKAGADDQGVPVLHFQHSDQSHPLPELHVGNKIDRI